MHTSLNEKAEENLRFIRSAIESATEFTGVSGKGYVLAGATAVIAAIVASGQADRAAWLGVWMFELVLAGVLTIGLCARKATALGESLFSGSGKKLLLAFIPTMIAGGMLTAALYLENLVHLLPGVWLAIYGAAVITAGAHSVRIVPMMGIAFMVLGCTALLLPEFGDLLLGLGMGGLHLLTGFLIWRHHGG